MANGNNNNIDPMLTTSDVARLLNVHINTVRRWSNQGIIKTYRIGSRGDRRFRQEDVSTFLAEQHNNGGDELYKFSEGVSG
jgi:excisionase family DNA binding protein